MPNRSAKRRTFAVVVAAAALAIPGVAGGDERVAAPCAWHGLEVPQVDGDLYLNALTVVGPTDVWIVGAEYPGYPTPSQPVLLHWDGKGLTRSAFRAPDTALSAVDGSSTSDVWAVGGNKSVGGTIALHWDGSAWKRVVTPNDRRSKNNQFGDVVALSRNEAWAIGHVSGHHPARVVGDWPVIQRWNGGRWTIVPPPMRRQGWLEGADGGSARDVWTVGFARPRRAPNGLVVNPIALHWNGRHWLSTRLPRTRYVSGRLSDVAATGRSAWAVGETDTAADRGESGKLKAYIVRWTGQRWKLAKIPKAFSRLWFSGVIAQSRNSVWAWSSDLIAKWNGSRWTPGPKIPFGTRPDAAIVALGSAVNSPLWLLGQYWNAQEQRTTSVVSRYICR